MHSMHFLWPKATTIAEAEKGWLTWNRWSLVISSSSFWQCPPSCDDNFFQRPTITSISDRYFWLTSAGAFLDKSSTVVLR